MNVRKSYASMNNSMNKRIIILTLCCSFLLCFGSRASGQETASAEVPDIKVLVENVSADSQKGAIFSYTYLMKFSYRHHRKLGLGRKFTRLYEAILPSRFSLSRNYQHQFILIQDSERAISDLEIMNKRKELGKQLERVENEEEEKPGSAPPLNEDGGYWTMRFSANKQKLKVDVLQLLKNSRLKNPRRRQLEGRKLISLEFAPDSDAVFEPALSYLSKIEGQIWIDEIDKRIVGIEGFSLGEFEKLKEKTDDERQQAAVFLFLQTKVSEGFWFPQTVRLNFAGKPEIFETVEIEYNFTNYKKSSVDIQTLDIKAGEGEAKDRKN